MFAAYIILAIVLVAICVVAMCHKTTNEDDVIGLGRDFIEEDPILTEKREAAKLAMKENGRTPMLEGGVYSRQLTVLKHNM